MTTKKRPKKRTTTPLKAPASWAAQEARARKAMETNKALIEDGQTFAAQQRTGHTASTSRANRKGNIH